MGLREWCLSGAIYVASALLAAGDDLWLERTVGVKRKPSDKTWVQMQTFTMNEAVAARKMSPAKLDKYGGWLDRKGKGTGFFRVEKRGDGWRIVDPEGADFVSIGICSVGPNLTENGKKALEKTFGTPENWTRSTVDLLKSNGFNTLGCWSSYSMFSTSGCQQAYTRVLNWMSSYGKKRGGTYQQPGHTGYPKDCIFVFDPGFEEYCNEEAKKLDESKNDSWLLGYFSDNEMPLSGKILSRYLSLPESDAGYQAAKRWFAERCGGQFRKPTQEDEDAFLEEVTDRYHRIVNSAIKKRDPNHLYLGSRIHGACFKSPAVLRGYGRNVDVMSINYYHAWNPDKDLLRMWAREGRKPFMITEWYAKGEDSGMGNTTGAGWLVKTQAERGCFYQTFTRGLLADPNCAGWHWFKYMDNDPTNKKADPSNLDSNKGVVSMVYEPYRGLLDAMRVMNAYVYPLADEAGAGKKDSSGQSP